MKIDFDDWQVTPERYRSDLALPLSVDDKITIFWERVDGWQLGIADQIINGVKDKNGKTIIEPIPDSAFAVLHIVLNFFETVAKYREGYAGKYKANLYFKRGVKAVFPELAQHSKDLIDRLLEMLYGETRCGLYHCGFSSSKVFVRSDINGSIGLTREGRLVINPQILVPNLRKYLKRYVERLHDINNTELRRNFEKRFDYDNELTMLK